MPTVPDRQGDRALRSTAMTGSSVGDLLDRALVGYATLGSVAEAVEDERIYVADLTAAWQARLASVRSERGDAGASPEVVEAVDAAVDEAASIDDPHQAIDWLSTLPQIILAALGEAT